MGNSYIVHYHVEAIQHYLVPNTFKQYCFLLNLFNLTYEKILSHALLVLYETQQHSLAAEGYTNRGLIGFFVQPTTL